MWNPYIQGDIEKLERVQMIATKLIRGMKNLSYVGRLKLLKVPTLRCRRQRGDMIEVFKIIRGFYSNFNPFTVIKQSHYNTRGHSERLSSEYHKNNLRKYNFSHRVVNVWNSLPESVIAAETIDAFKTGLDKHWSAQQLYFDWTEDLQGTGSRSS